MTTFRIAAAQMNSQEDKDKNLATAERLIDEAARQGARMIGFPEMFNIIGVQNYMENGAEEIPGRTSELLSRKAKEHGMYIHGGSIPEIVQEEKKVGNTTLVFDPNGEIIAKYRKIHLFDIDVKKQVSIKESDVFVRGQEMVNFETDYGSMGLTICYDIRFPELYRALTLNGAKVIFHPSAFTLYTGKDHWETLIRARAIENQVYMVSPAQFGSHGVNRGRRCFGSTMIVDPWGTVIARAPERECVIVADIESDAQDKVREQLPCLDHRRPDIYTS